MKALLLSLLMSASVAPIFAQGTKATPAKPAAPPAKAAPAPTATGFVGNKDSMLCHKADCKAVAKMKDANKASFASAADAQKADYKACKMCKPF